MVFNSFRLVFIPLLLAVLSAEASERPEDDGVKVNYVLQLSKFIHWPAIAVSQNSPIELCVFSTTPSLELFQKIHLQKSQEHEIHIRYINQDNQLSQCNILFVHKFIPNSIIRENYYSLISNNILSIGENENFAKEGGAIEFRINEDKVDIKINLQTAAEAGLGTNANLIEIASTVYQQGLD